MSTQKLVQKPLLICIVFVFAIMFFTPPVKAEDKKQYSQCTQAILVWQKAALECLKSIKEDLKTGLDTMEVPCGDFLKNKEGKMYETCGIVYQTRL